MKPICACIIMLLLGCGKTQHKLANTRWLVRELIVDSSNYLTKGGKEAYSTYDTTTRLHMSLDERFAYTYAEGKVADTCNYEVRHDTLFFVYDNRFVDTTIIIKLDADSFVSRSFSGIIQRSIRE